MRIATYLRVSTAAQHLEPQRLRLADYATARGLTLVAEYADLGESGAKARRPGLEALLAVCRRREVDGVLIARLDRLGRSVRNLCEVAAELDRLGVALLVADQGLDTSNAAGRFVFHTLAAVAELERELLRERTLAGLAAARRRGAKLGRPPVLDERQCDRAVRLVRNGTSAREVARMLGVSPGTVGRIVSGR